MTADSPKKPVLVLAADLEDGDALARAVGLTYYQVVTPHTTAREGFIMRALIITPAFVSLLQMGVERAHTAHESIRRDAVRSGVRV